MKLKFLIPLIIFGVLFAGYQYKKYRVAPEVKFKSLLLTDLDGNPFSLDELDADLIVLNFWASWCGPCRAELPILTKFMSDINNTNVAFIMISDEDLRRQNRYLQGRNYSMSFYKMQGKMTSIGIHTIPTTYFLDSRQAVIKTKVNGIDWEDQSLRDWVQQFKSS